MKFSVLASGSAGNAAFVRSGDTRIIVDCGISTKMLRTRLAEIGERLEDITAFIVTHAHGDHVNGLARAIKDGIRRGRAVPAYLTQATSERIDWRGLERPPVKYFEAGKSFVIGKIQVNSLSVPHDCLDPVAFVLADNQSKVGIATDLGFIPPALVSRFRSCDAVMIEANYDPDMLDACDRPDSIKNRIAGRNGHLSNAETTAYLESELGPNVRTLVLSHLSQETNHPSIIRTLATEALRRKNRYPSLIIAQQDAGTGIIEV